MKLRKFFFFTLVFAALVFCISCKGKNDPYADLDDDIIRDDSDTSADTDPDKDDDTGDTTDDTSDTAPDDDTDTDSGDHNNIPDESHETDHDPIDDSDSQSQDEDTDEPEDDPSSDDDADTEEQGDEDSIIGHEDPVVVCTGQNQCFNDYQSTSCPASPTSDFFGQDWQYAQKGYCLNKSFSTTNDLVTDNISGLIWQRKLPESYSGCTGSSGAACLYQQALEYCENLAYAGFSDWRLPTPEEFATIIDFGKTGPALDSDIFPVQTTTQKTFWTSAASLYSSGKSWSIDFTKGETREEQIASNYFYVRCVRGATLEKPSFKAIKDGEIIEDSQNNLFWTKSPSESIPWKDALMYCKNLEYADETGWRLPNINELASIIDHSTTRPASEFPGLTMNYLWSSTSYSGYAYNAWSVSASDGTIKSMDKTLTARVICVK